MNKARRRQYPICCCKIDHQNWSLLTTQNIFTSKAGVINSINMETAVVYSYGNSHNFEEPYTLGTLIPEEGNDHEFFIENGYCCQIMVSAIHERIILQKNSEEENQRLTQMLIRRGFLKATKANILENIIPPLLLVHCPGVL